jgi:hypothetical protein
VSSSARCWPQLPRRERLSSPSAGKTAPPRPRWTRWALNSSGWSGLDDPAAVGCYDKRRTPAPAGQRAGPGQPVPDRPRAGKPAAEPARPGPSSSAGARPTGRGLWACCSLVEPGWLPVRPARCRRGRSGQLGQPGSAWRWPPAVPDRSAALAQAGFSRLGCSGEPGHLRVIPIVSAGSAAQEVAGTSAIASLVSCRAVLNWPWRE